MTCLGTCYAAKGWKVLPCSCCNGLEWGGETPRECGRCLGSGGLWLSPSGKRIAAYPGYFTGQADQYDILAASPAECGCPE